MRLSKVTRKMPYKIDESAVYLGDEWCTFWLIFTSKHRKVVIAKAWRDHPDPTYKLPIHAEVARGRGITIEEAVRDIYIQMGEEAKLGRSDENEGDRTATA